MRVCVNVYVCMLATEMTVCEDKQLQLIHLKYIMCVVDMKISFLCFSSWYSPEYTKSMSNPVWLHTIHRLAVHTRAHTVMHMEIYW